MGDIADMILEGLLDEETGEYIGDHPKGGGGFPWSLARDLREAAIERKEAETMKLTTFVQGDLPNLASHCKQEACGFSLYRGVLVQWDEDHDERVLSVLDEMPARVLDRLMVVQEHEGSIAFLWDGVAAEELYYEEGDELSIYDGDIWHVLSSVSLEEGSGPGTIWK